MTKLELQEKIKCLEHNLQAERNSAENQYKVLMKLNDLLLLCGYTQRELNNYMVANEYSTGYLLEPKQKINILKAKEYNRIKKQESRKRTQNG